MSSRDLHDRKLSIFFILMTLSLVGNACADFGILWYAIEQSTEGASKDTYLSMNYVGQAVGSIILAPVLAVLFDRIGRKAGSIILDLSYALALMVILLLAKTNLLTPMVLLGGAIVTAGLAMTHKSSVAFAAIQDLATPEKVTSLVSKLMMSLTTASLIGAALSGVAYRVFGLGGCIAIGVLTFLPMIALYPQMFRKNVASERGPGEERKGGVILDFIEGFRALGADRVLLFFAVSIAIINIASSIMPGVVGLAFQADYPGRSDLFSIATATGILIATVFTKQLGEFGTKLKSQSFVAVSVAPAVIVLLIAVVWPSAWILAVAFATWCCGSAIRNVGSGSLRVSRVKKDQMGRVNTVYSAILNLGQILGGAFLVPVVQNDLRVGIGALLITILIGTASSYFILPQGTVEELRKAA